MDTIDSITIIAAAWGLLVLRLTLALILWPHGAQKVLGSVKNGYFANWSGKKAGEGVEFHLLYAGSALALLLTGPGPWSVDAWCMDIVHVIFG